MLCDAWVAAPFPLKLFRRTQYLQLECTLPVCSSNPTTKVEPKGMSTHPDHTVRNSTKTAKGSRAWRVPRHDSWPSLPRRTTGTKHSRPPMHFSLAEKLKFHPYFVDAVSTPASTNGCLAHGRAPLAPRSSWQRRRCCSAPRIARSVLRGTASRGGAVWRAAGRT